MIGFDPIHCGRVIASARIAICHVFGVTNCSRSACGEMRLLARRFLGGPWFGALLAILTIGIVLPSTARAGCAAHYVNSRSPWNGEVAHLELLNFTGAIPAPAEETPGERPKPCSGALCSGNPAPPLFDDALRPVPDRRSMGAAGLPRLPAWLGGLPAPACRHRRFPRRSLVLDLPPPSLSGYLSHILTT